MSLSQPSRTIVVEPLEVSAPAPQRRDAPPEPPRRSAPPVAPPAPVEPAAKP